jgi:hypothetical protein
MGYNYYDTKLINLLQKNLEKSSFQILDAKKYVDFINSNFLFLGNRIDFEKLKSVRHCRPNKDSFFDETSSFIELIIKENNLNLEGEVIYLGDNLTEQAYEFKLKNLIKLLPAFLEIPQHHYFINDDKWCLVISFENDIDFGKL